MRLKNNKGYMNIKEQLQKGEVKFTIKGITTYRSDDNGEYGMNPKIFKVSKGGDSIYAEFDGMNVTKWGPTCVTLYTFDMLGRKSVGKMNYKDITICAK
jgi:hypothetical protein|tara:strand:- start:551 stop:847 length:297 start_codon:yes stop_codon:yes gene_type:complete